VVSFDSARAGTPAAIWSRDARFDDLPAVDLAGVRRLIVVAAHPDDETLGAGALIAQAGAAGIAVTVVVVTDGAASHPRSPSTTPGEVRETRAAEAVLAVRRLDADAELHMLGFADGAVRENRAAIAETVRAVTADSDDGTLLVAPWRGDGHRDHRVVGEICAEIAGDTVPLLEYPIWLWHWAAPADGEVPWSSFVALRPDARSLEAKRSAIEAYTSQTAPLSDRAGDEAVLHPEFLRNFAGDSEFFVREAGEKLGRAYFDDLYDRHDDPWGFTSRWYERRKRAVTMAALPEERYLSALEIGCSIGVLTEQLAARCDAVTAVDVSAAAVARARERLAHERHVRVEVADVASAFPSGDYDLVVLSEVGYYFEAPVLRRILSDTADALSPGGTVVLCHWRHTVDDYALTGDEVHDIAAHEFGGSMTRLLRHEEVDFVLDVYSPDARSVASRTGLL
jgi:LmbE family N-acetylglucosaminyl deacetylase/SAM-dependent methyltransferase